MTPVEIRCPTENSEACAYADEIAEFLKKEEWPVKGGAVIRDSDFPRRLKGVGIKIQRGDQGSTAVQLFWAFNTAGVEVKSVHASEGTRYDPLQILVGW